MRHFSWLVAAACTLACGVSRAADAVPHALPESPLQLAQSGSPAPSRPLNAAPANVAPLPAAPATPVDPAQRAGTLKQVQGRVTLAGAGGAATREATPGGSVLASDQIVTEPGGGASLVLRDGTTLVLGPGSRLDLRDFAFDSTTNEGSVWVSLLRGSMRMITGLIGKTQPAAVRVQARTMTIGVRGTDFIVEVEGP
jgi:hypothetical protein